jgi:hypothetical protein
MKSKEEIEQLAEQYTQDGIYLSDSEKQQTEIAYMIGYKQCQEDMDDEIKKQIYDFTIDLKESTSTYVKQNCEGAIFGLNRLLNSLNKKDNDNI